MLYSLSVSVAGIFGLMLLWFTVQQGWRKVFARPAQDDVLACRESCHGCEHHKNCSSTSGTTRMDGSNPILEF